MSPHLTALFVAVAGPVGVIVILALATFVAAALAARINPDPDLGLSVEEQVRRAEAHQAESEQSDERIRRWEIERHGESIDSLHISFPVFGIACAVALVAQLWDAALSHMDDQGQGPPLAAILNPLWISPLVAFLAGVVAGSIYKRWFHRQPRHRQAQILQGRKDKERRSFEDRLRSIRDQPSKRRSRSKEY
ncbi:hypothetical protein [Glycomyces buryatensis]|uniref:Uncharacterized protein n=1 Tax=Glycomyces buryatensis TaxID=2570927 RepID=A0A4S8QET6_9ACTN|nr:hypothetical protein [Glycomyces buryatensis]THV41425.1 hypothetical protein FAB82_11545 [Glycomyces buryatensis]